MTYVISDVHGNYERWEDIKDKINLTDDDRLIVLGDVIDRGPDGIKILQEIMKMGNVIMMMGNHELMMLESLSFAEGKFNGPGNMSSFWNWTHNNGGQVTYEAFLSLPANEQGDILGYLSQLPSRLHVEANGRRFTLIHGFTNDEGTVEADVWSRPKGIHCPSGLTDGSTLVVGHTPVVNLMDREGAEEAGRSNFRILHADDYIDIDCCCAYPGIEGSALGCIRLDDMAEFYSVHGSKDSFRHMIDRLAECTDMLAWPTAFWTGTRLDFMGTGDKGAGDGQQGLGRALRRLRSEAGGLKRSADQLKGNMEELLQASKANGGKIPAVNEIVRKALDERMPGAAHRKAIS